METMFNVHPTVTNEWLRVSKPPACPTTMTHFNSSLQLSFENKVKGRTWCINIRRSGASSWYSDDQIRFHWALSVQYWSMEKVTDCESTDDSQQLISDFNMEELKEKWTREQLELSKRVSEVLRKKLSQFSPETFTGWWVSWRCIKHWSFWRPRHQFHWRGFRQCLCLLRCYQQKLGGNSIVCAKYDILPFKVIYHESKMVKLTAPYIPSFLGFREADILSKMVSTDYLFGWQLKIWSNT